MEYLSPSSISLFNYNRDEFYLHYVAGVKKREPQTAAMAVGSSFDAYVKSFLYENLFGKDHDPRFELKALFEAQVEAHQRDLAWNRGKHVFEEYKSSGVLSDLLLLLASAESSPRFEFEIRGVKHGYREGIEGKFGEVTLLGKPDVDFTLKDGVHVILDWKVNGYLSNASPSQYYVRMRAAGKTHLGMHYKCIIQDICGIPVNRSCFLENVNESWARQLAIYGWLTGESVGGQFITMIHQVACKAVNGCLPSLRFAEINNYVGKEFQVKVFDNACEIWETVHSDWFFRDIPKEQSQQRCAYLQGLGKLASSEDEMDKMMFDMTRSNKRW